MVNACFLYALGLVHPHQLLRWQAEAAGGEGAHSEVDTDETTPHTLAVGLLCPSRTKDDSSGVQNMLRYIPRV
jgi:hypothetical protein